MARVVPLTKEQREKLAAAILQATNIILHNFNGGKVSDPCSVEFAVAGGELHIIVERHQGGHNASCFKAPHFETGDRG